MASKRVTYSKSRRPDQFEPEAVYAGFMADLLAGNVTATKLYDVHDGKGNVKLEYDDPTGQGQGQGQSSKSALGAEPTPPSSPVPSPGAASDR